jgi:ATP phosphoribosyltransferase regulatory subunit
LSGLFGSEEVLDTALSLVDNERSIKAIERLRQVYEILKIYGVEKYISFDLAMVSKYNYYTGVIFNAYTYHAGSAIAKGGRYDRLLEKFGKPAAATGFVVNVDDLVSVLTRQKRCPELENKNVLIVYSGDIKAAIGEAKKYRSEGYNTALLKLDGSKDHYNDFAAENNIGKVIFI